jgi:hypothetical protein
MNIQALIKLFRKQASDEASPFLWDDEELLQYIIDAQDILVRKMGGISAVTVPAASDVDDLQLHDLVLTADTPTTSFSPYILRIRSARLVTEKRNVQVISESDFGQIQTSDYGDVSPVYLDDTDTGTVTHAIIGFGDHRLRWYKVPSAADSCRLHVYRLPYPRIEAQEDALEIDEQHHIHLLKWVKYHAYSKEDAETYNKNLADTNEEAFERYCEKVRDEKDRQRFKPRTVQYGGI